MKDFRRYKGVTYIISDNVNIFTFAEASKVHHPVILFREENAKKAGVGA